MEKVYTIEITGQSHQARWYNDKSGRRYKATRVEKSYTEGSVNGTEQFKVSDLLFIPPLYCKIITEYEKYNRDDEVVGRAFIRPKAEYSNRQF